MTHSERGGLEAGGFDPGDEGILHGGVVYQVGKGWNDVQAQLLLGKR